MGFERIEMREKDCGDGQVWENPIRIEKHDHEYYQAYEKHVIEEIREKLGIKDEKSTSKTTTRKPKKDDTKPNKPTVADLQEKL